MGDIVDGLMNVAEENDEISVKALIAEFGDRSFAPFMLLLALVGMLPTGGIPGVPTFVSICIALVAVQLAWGRDHIWVPGFIARRSVSSDKLWGATDKLKKVATVLDRLAEGRMQWLTTDIGLRVIGTLIVVICCFVPPLELVPFAAAIPFAAIALLSLAIIVRDGLIILIAGLLAIGGIGYAAFAFMG
jgi:hypothetical protein